MSFDRPSPDDDRKTVSDTEVNEALENGELEQGDHNFDKVDHDAGRPSAGPQPNEPRRTPSDQDVTTGNEGQPVEPPD